MREFYFSPTENDIGSRLDVYLAANQTEYSRSALKRVLDTGGVCVNGKTAKANYKLRGCDKIILTAPLFTQEDITPQNIPLDILFEDSDIIVVNKPQGMVVHPGAGNFENTLVSALLYHCGVLSTLNGDFRAGIVHRIDKDTSGVLVAAKNDIAHRKLAEQFHEHSITREYIAIARGVIKKDEFTIDAPIGRNPNDRLKMAINRKNGKRAVTRFSVVSRLKKHTQIKARLETGRTHQIRVHLSSIGHPLAGDLVYGSSKFANEPPLNGQALHAQTLGFIHPTTGEYIEFCANAPKYFKELLEIL